jgi:hypothetical protein
MILNRHMAGKEGLEGAYHGPGSVSVAANAKKRKVAYRGQKRPDDGVRTHFA